MVELDPDCNELLPEYVLLEDISFDPEYCSENFERKIPYLTNTS